MKIFTALTDATLSRRICLFNNRTERMDDQARQELEAEYRNRRRGAREIVASEFREKGFDLELTEIGRSALTSAAQWFGRRVDWQWELLHLKYRKIPKRIELAIWSEGSLAGLCYGRVSEGRLIARIDRLERDPREVEMTGYIAPIATRFLDVMAPMCGCEQSVIWGPAPGAVETYRTLGFTHELKNKHGLIGLAKKLPRRPDPRKVIYYGD